MDSVMKRIAKKCREAKKKLVIITPVKRRKTTAEEPYLKEMIQSQSRRDY